jgi:hypothetical protein
MNLLPPRATLTEWHVVRNGRQCSTSMANVQPHPSICVLTCLSRVEDALEAAGIRYDRLDGTMKRDDRTRAMDTLKYDPACEVLLVSLKAGGVGLNLTAAQRVYLMDPYWYDLRGPPL